MRTTAHLLLGIALAGMLFVAACEDDDNGDANGNGIAPADGTPGEGGNGAGATTIDATMSDFEINLAQSSAPPGETTFVVLNEGPSEHEFVVVQTDMAADSLPVEGGVVVEDEIDIVGRTEVYPAGETRELTEELESGPYVIICNVPGHYQLGMYTDFTVE